MRNNALHSRLRYLRNAEAVLALALPGALAWQWWRSEAAVDWVLRLPPAVRDSRVRKLLRIAVHTRHRGRFRLFAASPSTAASDPGNGLGPSPGEYLKHQWRSDRVLRV